MVFEFKLPDIGEGIHEGEIVEWLVAEGDQVDEDQDIVEVMTDKATVQISSPKAGTVESIRYGEGDTVEVGEVIITIAVDGEPSQAPETDQEPDDESPAEESAEPASERPKVEASTGGNGASPAKRTPAGILAPPSVRIEAREQGIDLTQLEGSGPGGRITMADLEAHGTRQTGQEDQPPQAPSGGVGALGFQVGSVDRSDASSVEPVQAPGGSPRASSARAKHHQAHFSYVLSVDAGRLVRAVEEAQPLAAQHEVEVDDQVFVLKAVAQALKKHPRCNALVDEGTGELVVKEPVDLAVARHTPDGLRATTIEDAEGKGIIQIARALHGGGGSSAPASATVTTLGELGGYASTPVLDHPQVTGVAIGRLRDVARYEEGELVAGKELTLSFSFDHRYVDGYDGAVFAKAVARLLEDPSALLLEAR